MKILHHLCMPGFSNCYALGKGTEAIIIDPGSVSIKVIDFIEQENYALIGILVTHNHANHVNGIRALKRIYDVDVYAANQTVLDKKTNIVKDGDIFDLGMFRIKVISTPGHSIDSVVYNIGTVLFTGDVLSAGLIGKTDSSYGAMREIANIQNKLFTLHGNYEILPGHGPPSTLDLERRCNVEIGLFQENRNNSRKNSYNLDLLD